MSARNWIMLHSKSDRTFHSRVERFIGVLGGTKGLVAWVLDLEIESNLVWVDLDSLHIYGVSILIPWVCWSRFFGLCDSIDCSGVVTGRSGFLSGGLHWWVIDGFFNDISIREGVWGVWVQGHVGWVV
jgi:hypothetical protein